MWRYFFLILITLKKNTNVLDSRQLLEKGHLFGNELGGSSKEKASASVGFVAGYEACQREYEDKLRWIPITEKFPNAYRSSENWDGLRSEEIVFKTDKEENYIGTFYSGTLDGSVFNDFADECGFVIPNVTLWCSLSFL